MEALAFLRTLTWINVVLQVLCAVSWSWVYKKTEKRLVLVCAFIWALAALISLAGVLWAGQG